jgi:hypothetical protein
MGGVIGDLLPLALGIAISPMPIVSEIILMFGPQGRIKGFAFLLGWVVGLSTMIVLVFLLANGRDYSRQSTPSRIVAWGMLACGLALLVMAYISWRRRPQPGAEFELPKWLQSVHEVSPWMSLWLGVSLGLVSPKNLVFVVTAAAVIGQAGLEPVQATFAMALFALIAGSSIVAPIYVSIVQGAEAQATLGEWENWLIANSSAIMAVLCLIMGASLLGKGISGLT